MKFQVSRLYDMKMQTFRIYVTGKPYFKIKYVQLSDYFFNAAFGLQK